MINNLLFILIFSVFTYISCTKSNTDMIPDPIISSLKGSWKLHMVISGKFPYTSDTTLGYSKVINFLNGGKFIKYFNQNDTVSGSYTITKDTITIMDNSNNSSYYLQSYVRMNYSRPNILMNGCDSSDLVEIYALDAGVTRLIMNNINCNSDRDLFKSYMFIKE